MHADTVLMLLLTAIGAAALPTWAWWRTWRRLDSLQRALEPRVDADARLDQVERTLEALVTGQAQLMESHDFLARVLTTRLPTAGATGGPEPPTATTPH